MGCELRRKRVIKSSSNKVSFFRIEFTRLRRVCVCVYFKGDIYLCQDQFPESVVNYTDFMNQKSCSTTPNSNLVHHSALDTKQNRLLRWIRCDFTRVRLKLTSVKISLFIAVQRNAFHLNVIKYYFLTSSFSHFEQWPNYWV